jgi:plastocyanin
MVRRGSVITSPRRIAVGCRPSLVDRQGMNTRRLIPLLAAGALALSAAPASAATQIDGLVGPGFNISISKGGKKVTSLKAGKYTFKVVDKTNAHDFVLNGPGISNKTITGLKEVGTKSMTVTLKKGTYIYFCTPHKSMMQGSIKVT